jgi:hypothetical protein
MGVEKGRGNNKLGMMALGGYALLFYILYKVAAFSQ